MAGVVNRQLAHLRRRVESTASHLSPPPASAAAFAASPGFLFGYPSHGVLPCEDKGGENALVRWLPFRESPGSLCHLLPSGICGSLRGARWAPLRARLADHIPFLGLLQQNRNPAGIVVHPPFVHNLPVKVAEGGCGGREVEWSVEVVAGVG